MKKDTRVSAKPKMQPDGALLIEVWTDGYPTWKDFLDASGPQASVRAVLEGIRLARSGASFAGRSVAGRSTLSSGRRRGQRRARRKPAYFAVDQCVLIIHRANTIAAPFVCTAQAPICASTGTNGTATSAESGSLAGTRRKGSVAMPATLQPVSGCKLQIMELGVQEIHPWAKPQDETRHIIAATLKFRVSVAQ